MSAFIVGLTGGISSGKSTVLNFFHQLGVNTFSADDVVHQLMTQNGLAYTTIVEYFGKNILTSENDIDRSKLRARIFNSLEEKRWLEDCLHPLVRKSLLENCRNANSLYAMVEIPLLVEAKIPFEWIDRILVVDTEETTQLLRAQARSGLSEHEINNIMNQQATRNKRNSQANDLIVNVGDLNDLQRQVKKLHQSYIDRWSSIPHLL